MREVVIVSRARTPQGSFQGSLSTVPAIELGAVAMRAAVERAGIKPEQVDEVFMGNVLMGGEGQAPGRQAMIEAGIPKSTPASTVNKVCGSGMKTVIMAMQSIQTGDNDVVVAGGMENMSAAPYLMPKARAGFRMGHQQVYDSMIFDGLWDPYGDRHMGNCAELCAREKSFSREMQDSFAAESFRRAQTAQKAGKFKEELVSVEVKGRKGSVTVSEDEGPMKVKFEKIPQLRPAFEKDGSVTAANASTINDGAAALVLMSADKAKELGVKPLARVVSWGGHAQDPEWFTTAPVQAMERALKKAEWTAADVDLVEVNEAFAVVAMNAQKELDIPHEKLNVWGSGISLGHPIGASGARLLVTLVSALKDQGKKKGMASLCIGGGEGLAVCIELI